MLETSSPPATPAPPAQSEQPVLEGHVETFQLMDNPAGATQSSTAVAEVADRRHRSRIPDTDRRRVQRSPRAHLFVTLSHWGMVVLLTLSLLTGMRIGWGYLESAFGGYATWWGSMLGALAPKGSLLGVNVITLHVLLSFLLILVSGVYVGYLVRSHTTRRLHITQKDLQKLFAGLYSGSFWRNKPALWSANLLVYWTFFVAIAVLMISGVALYRLDWGLSTVLGGYNVQRFLHALIAYLLLPYAVLHVVLQWFFGRFWTIFKANVFAPHVRAGLLALALTLPIVGGLYIADSLPTTLTVPRLASTMPAPVLDGNANDPAWNQAQAVTIRTVKGVNNPRDYVDVQVKALHTGNEVYFQFQWDDPNVSYKRFPLLKTDKGWKVLQTAFANSDENVYYEDKLSVYFTTVANGSCADTCHLGVGPYSAVEEKHGLHYTTHGETGDVWHWKSVRTNPMGEASGQPGYADDQHFRPKEPEPADPRKDRYSGGYYPDPKTGGGYDYNFTKIDPEKSLNDTYVRPKFLPRTNAILPNPDPATSEQGVIWWIAKGQGIPYSEEADTYPVGTLIPNIVIAPFEGDRGDVRAQGAWHQGRWTLEVRRILDTHSKYDVAFVPGQPVYITVATYNRTQTRHGEHIKPVRMVLQP